MISYRTINQNRNTHLIGLGLNSGAVGFSAVVLGVELAALDDVLLPFSLPGGTYDVVRDVE